MHEHTAQLQPVDRELEALSCSIVHHLGAPEGLSNASSARLMSHVVANLVATRWKFTARKDDACDDVGVRESPGCGAVFFVREVLRHAACLGVFFSRCVRAP